MPVSPPQGHNDNSAAATPDPTVGSCSVGESESTAYVKGLVEGVDATVLIDSGSNVSLISEEFTMSIPALQKHVLNTQYLYARCGASLCPRQARVGRGPANTVGHSDPGLAWSWRGNASPFRPSSAGSVATWAEHSWSRQMITRLVI